MKFNLENKIKNKQITVGIIGLGYVGLPLVIRFIEEGINVIGFDIDQRKVENLHQGKSYIRHITSDKINVAINQGFKATNDFSHVKNVDVILICVPTPLGDNNIPDLSYIKSTLNTVKSYLVKNQLLILESTTYPGTTEEEIFPVLKNIGFNIGENYFLGYSPEREDPGNSNYNTKTIPKIVSGHTSNCLKVTKLLYDQIVNRTVVVSSTRAAEMTKILENIHRAVNIGLVNELKMVADKMNIDIYEVIEAASTKPFGFTPYYPGPGLGGHCIPIDPFYLTWKAKQYGVETRFIELAGKVNTSMPEWVINKAKESLFKNGKKLKNANVLILGMAYKKNVDDLRESPSFELIRLLYEHNAKVNYHDFYIPKLYKTRKYNFNLNSVSLDNVSEYDIIILSTDHDNYDYNKIMEEAQLIIDTRGRFPKNNSKIVRA